MHLTRLVALCLLGGTALLHASVDQAPPPSFSQTVAALFARASAHLTVSKPVSSALSVHVIGTRTRSLETRPTDEPLDEALLLPGFLRVRHRTVTHTLAGARFFQRPQYDEDTRRTAARSMKHRLIVFCLTYLARVPPEMTLVVEDLGVRDFEWVKGRTLGVRDPQERLRLELVLDAVDSRPLAVVTHGMVAYPDGTTAIDDTVGLLNDYREVSGIRFPFQVEERSKADHARVSVTSIVVNTLTAADFTETSAAAR